MITTREQRFAKPCNEITQSVLAVHYMVARYPANQSMYALCAGCEWTNSFASPGEARKEHAAHVLEILNDNDIEVIEADGRVYAAAAVEDTGTVCPISRTFGTQTEAEQDLAVLLGDDYYKDRQPFIAAAPSQTWRPIEQN
ncbi:hypothetical protein [Mycobacteroides chelonae]|nr:hypothetical protein [Mycobacteroides chelonae]